MAIMFSRDYNLKARRAKAIVKPVAKSPFSPTGLPYGLPPVPGRMRHFEPDDIIAPREHLKDWLPWALRVVSQEGDGSLQAAPLGGGPVYIINPMKVEEYDFVKVPAKLLNNPKWKSVEVYAEWFEKKYRAWVTGQKWNGWAMPFFEFDEAMKYATDSQKEGTGAGMTQYDPARDAFVTLRDDPEETEVDEATVILVKGRGALKVYPIGAGSWTWSEAREDEEEEEEDEA